MTLNPGDIAPVFSLPDAAGNLVSLADFRGRRVVLYFYPRDNTPGCTKEACGFRDIYSEYRARNIAVLGVSTDEAKSHAKFAAKYQLPFPLLCDSKAEVATTAVTDSKSLWVKNLWELFDRPSRSTQMVGLKRFIAKSNPNLTQRRF